MLRLKLTNAAKLHQQKEDDKHFFRVGERGTLLALSIFGSLLFKLAEKLDNECDIIGQGWRLFHWGRLFCDKFRKPALLDYVNFSELSLLITCANRAPFTDYYFMHTPH